MKFKLIILSCFVAFCGCAFQHEVDFLDHQVTSLEQRNAGLDNKYEKLLSELKNHIKTGQAEKKRHNSQYAGTKAMLDDLREEIYSLNGKLDETEYFLKQKTAKFEDLLQRFDDFKKMSSSNKKQLLLIGQYLNFEVSGKDLKEKELKIKSNSRFEKELTEKKLYASSKHAFDKENFETALDGFQKFITKYPKSKNADNAQFWIGEIYYREKWYEKAVLEYQKVIEKYPKGNKIQASLLKQGFAFYNIKDKVNARLILKELCNKYPKSNEAKIAKQKLKNF